MNKLFFTDSDGKKSVTVTAFILGFVIVNIKLLASGLTLGSYTMSAFTGSDYAMAIGALGAVYVMRRNGNKKKKDEAKDGE